MGVLVESRPPRLWLALTVKTDPRNPLVARRPKSERGK
jgi:hypothetical protein